MFKLLSSKRFATSESGASLVEYAVALIVVTLIGAGGVLGVGNDAGTLAGNASDVVSDAVDAL